MTLFIRSFFYNKQKANHKERKHRVTLKQIFKIQVSYYVWRIQNPFKPFHEFYIDRVKQNVNRHKYHPTLGPNIKDAERFYQTAKIEKRFLVDQGLEPHHKFVDYGCGSLRLGSLLIPFLDTYNYIGLDMTDTFFSMGKERLGNGIIQQKKPKLEIIKRESLQSIKQEGIDCLMASAVLYHIPYKELSEFFSNILFLLKSKGKAFVDFTDGEKIKKVSWATWVYPYDLLKSIVTDLNGETSMHEFNANDSAWYPDGHKIIQITHR